MQTRLLGPDDVGTAGGMIRAGQLVVFPTETVYGLGACAIDSNAIRAVFAAKDRPADNPLIVHLASVDEALDAVPRGEGLLRAALEGYAPGPLTIVIPAPSWAVPEVRGGLPTIALRVPALQVARQIIAAAGVPVAAPSANRSGRPSPTSAVMAMAEMSGRVAAVVDGGSCALGIESTIITAVADRELVVLRPGSISAAEIAARLGCPVRGRTTHDAIAPGTRYRHYTPVIPVILVPSELMARAAAEARGLPGGAGTVVLTAEQFDGFAGYAEQLYRAFWEAERAGAPCILAERPPPGHDEGLADRLYRAASAEYRPGVLSEVVQYPEG